MRPTLPVLAVLLLLAAGVLGAATMGRGPSAESPPVSRPDLPRYVSLRYDGVNARVNLGVESRLKWRYRPEGLPLLVIAEVGPWRRVCDPEGGIAWVHSWNLTARRTVMNTRQAPEPMYRNADARSPVKAALAPRALARLDRCRHGWCRVEVGGVSGWTREGALWGTNPKAWCSINLDQTSANDDDRATRRGLR